MSEPSTEATPESVSTDAPEEASATPQTFDDLLAGMEEGQRNLILDRVNKTNREAKNLRERLKGLEPKAAEYERLEAASKTDAERAQEALTAANQRAANLVAKAARSEIKAALAGVVDNPDTIVKRLDLSQFVNEDGEVDDQAVAELKAEYAPFSASRAPRPDRSQASAANGKSVPLTPQQEFAALISQSRR